MKLLKQSTKQKKQTTVNKLKQAQQMLSQAVKIELDQPDFDVEFIKEVLDILNDIDTLRRTKWNKDTFGEYEKTYNSFGIRTDELKKAKNYSNSDELNDSVFSSDDIPF